MHIGHILIACTVIGSMSGVELSMRFESAHAVPTIFKLLHFVTSLLIAYDGPWGAVIGDSRSVIGDSGP